MSKRESPFTFRMATLEDLDTCVSLAMQIPLEKCQEKIIKNLELSLKLRR